jgi:gas vesicle protein
MSDDNSQGAFFIGLVLGGLVGAGVALLMTPQSGQQTRSQLQTKGIELKSQLGETAAELQDRGKVIVHEKLPQEGASSAEEPSETPMADDDQSATDEESA